MAVKNISALKKAILEKAQQGMKKEVLPVVQEQMQKSITEEVYNVYTPIEYERRRYSRGGLGDKSVMKGYALNETSNGFKFMVQNEARAKNGSGLIAPLIIKGDLWAVAKNYIVQHSYYPSYDTMYFYHTGGRFVPYYQPRDFMSHTKANLDKNELANKLKNFMKK